MTWVDYGEGFEAVPGWGLPMTRKVQRYIAYGQKGRALQTLKKIIEDDMPLFYQIPGMLEDRRLAWLYRIDLLRDWGRLWVSMNPVGAQ